MALTTKLLRLSIAKECGVSRNFVRKVIDELHLNGGRVLRSTEQEERESAENSALCKLSSFVVFRLYLKEPSTNLDSYRESLYRYTGISVSNASIERFFIDTFPFRGTFCKPNLVPYDKFKPENEARLVEYISFIVQQRPARIKFGDEKSLKGQELFS